MTARLFAKGLVLAATLIQASDVLSQNVVDGLMDQHISETNAVPEPVTLTTAEKDDELAADLIGAADLTQQLAVNDTVQIENAQNEEEPSTMLSSELPDEAASTTRQSEPQDLKVDPAEIQAVNPEPASTTREVEPEKLIIDPAEAKEAASTTRQSEPEDLKVDPAEIQAVNPEAASTTREVEPEKLIIDPANIPAVEAEAASTTGRVEPDKLTDNPAEIQAVDPEAATTTGKIEPEKLTAQPDENPADKSEAASTTGTVEPEELKVDSAKIQAVDLEAATTTGKIEPEKLTARPDESPADKSEAASTTGMVEPDKLTVDPAEMQAVKPEVASATEKVEQEKLRVDPIESPAVVESINNEAREQSSLKLPDVADYDLIGQKALKTDEKTPPLATEGPEMPDDTNQVEEETLDGQQVKINIKKAPSSKEGATANPAQPRSATSSDDIVVEESKFEDSPFPAPSVEGQALNASRMSQIQRGEAALDALVVDWLGQTEAEPIKKPDTKIAVQRVVIDDDLATAAASVRQSWQLMAPERIENLMAGSDANTSPAMQIAMIASAIAEIIGNLEFVANAETPLVFIRGQSVSIAAITTTTTTTRSALSLLSGSALGLPFLASRASRSFIGQAMGAPPKLPAPQLSLPTPLPSYRSSPFSYLWPNGATPSDNAAYMRGSSPARASSLPAAYSSTNLLPAQNPWNSYSSLITRKLSEISPTLQHEHKERFGNFLHDELPREIKRKIWDDFVSDSRRARSAEEQNALLRKLERGQDHVRTRSPPRRLIEVAARPVTVAEKVAFGANKLQDTIKSSSDFSVIMAEAARLFLATLEPTSQTRLMKMLVENGAKDDEAFIQYEQTHDVDADLQIGLLLLSRLRNVLMRADI